MEKFIAGVIGFMLGVCIVFIGMLVYPMMTGSELKSVSVDSNSIAQGDVTLVNDPKYKVELKQYDPNDPAYKFIPEAPQDWREKFGTNERTRLLHSISELRVVVAAQAKLLQRLVNEVEPNEPNES